MASSRCTRNGWIRSTDPAPSSNSITCQRTDTWSQLALGQPSSCLQKAPGERDQAKQLWDQTPPWADPEPSDTSHPRTYLKALGADFLPLLHPCDTWLGVPRGLAHEGGHPSRQPSLVLRDLNEDRFAWRDGDTKSAQDSHYRHGQHQVAVMGMGSWQKRPTEEITVTPNPYTVLCARHTSNCCRHIRWVL